MTELLYLDTARRGQISETASRVLNEIVRFNADYGSCLYFDDLLYGGFGNWEPKLKSRFPNLQWWQGIDQLKCDFREMLGGNQDTGNVLLASRTAELMTLSAKMLFARCRNVLILDSTWPSYEEILASQIPNDSCRVTKVAVKHDILHRNLSPDEIVEQISRTHVSEECDGLFLPMVCNLGIKLPIEKIVTEIEKIAPLRFVVVDAAQSTNQIDQEFLTSIADFIFFGTHKWLNSLIPMGIGAFCKPSSRSFVEESIERYLNDGRMSDPLLAFSSQDCRSKQFSETVNLTPLFAGAGAVWDAQNKNTKQQCDRIVQNRAFISDVLAQSDWSLVLPDDEFQSRIQLVQSELKMRQMSPSTLARHFLDFGVAVTGYTDGLCRISIPDGELSRGQMLSFKNVAANS